MSEDRIGPDEAERILRDAADGPRPGQDPLTAFLAAAAAPAADHELAGEDAAAAAFRAARQGRSATQSRGRLAPPAIRRRRPLIARVLTVKTAVALGLCASAAGGVALAAGTGALPGPIGGERPASHRASPHPTRPHPLTTPPTAPLPGGPGDGASTAGAGSPTPSPSPSPALPSPTPPGNGTGKANGTANGKGDADGKKKDDKEKKPKKSHTPHPGGTAGKDASG